MNKSRKIMLRVFLYILTLVIVAVLSLATGIIGTVVYEFLVVDKFSASSMIAVKYEVELEDNAISEEDLSESNNLAENFSIIFKYSQEMQDVIPTGYEVEITRVEDTSILEITVTGADPQLCADTANAIATASPDIISKYYVSGSAGVLDIATPNYKPINNSTEAFGDITLISAAVLSVAAVSIIVIAELIIFSIRKRKISNVK